MVAEMAIIYKATVNCFYIFTLQKDRWKEKWKETMDPGYFLNFFKISI